MTVNANHPLGALLSAASSATSYSQLRGRLMDALGPLMDAQAWGIYLIDDSLRPHDVAAAGVPDAFLFRYEEIGRPLDPVMMEVLDTHTPSHNLKTRTVDAWHAEPLYQHVSSRFG